MYMRLFSVFLLAAAIAGCDRLKPAALVVDSPSSSTTGSPPPAPDKLVLYAIDGLVNGPDDSASDTTHFHGYEILGKVEITDRTIQQQIVKAVQDGIKESDGTVAACFWPRHGVRLVSDGKTVDYVICYECLQLRIFSKDGDTGKPTVATHQAVLTAPLTAAGVKLAPSVEETRNSN